MSAETPKCASCGSANVTTEQAQEGFKYRGRFVVACVVTQICNDCGALTVDTEPRDAGCKHVDALIAARGR